MKNVDGSDAGSARVIAECATDVGFYAKWLLLAVKSQRHVGQLTSGRADPEFATALERLSIACELDFSRTALEVVARIVASSKYVVAFSSYDAEPISMMTELGFFTLRGSTLRMSMPRKVSRSLVREAILKLARTEDRDHMLHPKKLLTRARAPRMDGQYESVAWRNGSVRNIPNLRKGPTSQLISFRDFHYQLLQTCLLAGSLETYKATLTTRPPD